SEKAFILDQLEYPEAAKAIDLKGQVIVGFTVDELGLISNVRLMRGIGYGCDEEVIRVIRAMPLWNPKRINGIPTATEVLRHIAF
ncbi:MAG: energy transducer TonB, partial [Bacteroidota bacterium]